jgi:hypothetical protein
MGEIKHPIHYGNPLKTEVFNGLFKQKGEKVMEYNFSKDSEYHTQINNKIMPAETCNTTSMIMALKQAGHKSIFALDGEQPEDYLTNFLLNNPESQARMKYRYSGFVKNDIPAYEIHEMLAWGINYLMTKDIDTFSMNVDIEFLIEKLLQGCGIVLSGLFPVRNTMWGHIISLAGIITSNDDLKPTYANTSFFIIDDPRGNFRTDYENIHGNDVGITRAEFMALFKDLKSRTHKWAHIIEPNKGKFSTDLKR